MDMQTCVRCEQRGECYRASEVTYMPTYADDGPFCHGCLCWWLCVSEQDVEGGPPAPTPSARWLEHERRWHAQRSERAWREERS